MNRRASRLNADPADELGSASALENDKPYSRRPGAANFIAFCRARRADEFHAAGSVSALTRRTERSSITPDQEDGTLDAPPGPLASWRREAGADAGRFEGAPYGSDVSFFVVDMAPGEGPALHRHPYSETFVVLAGRVRFELGGRRLVTGAGDVVVAPRETPHGFQSLGPERLRLVAIHAAGRMETTWLEAAGAAAEDLRAPDDGPGPDEGPRTNG